MYDHSTRTLEDLLQLGLLVHLIERYTRRPGAVVLTIDGEAVEMTPRHAHLFLCGMLWTTRPE